LGYEGQELETVIQLSNTALSEFHKAASISSLDTAISLHRDALRIRTPRHVSRPASLAGLASTLHSRFYRTGHVQDLDEAISLCQEAIANPSHSKRTTWLNNLSAVHLTRFETTGHLFDLRDAISLYRERQEINVGNTVRGGVSGSFVSARD
jgi:hypothetical protein